MPQFGRVRELSLAVPPALRDQELDRLMPLDARQVAVFLLDEPEIVKSFSF